MTEKMSSPIVFPGSRTKVTMSLSYYLLNGTQCKLSRLTIFQCCFTTVIYYASSENAFK